MQSFVGVRVMVKVLSVPLLFLHICEKPHGEVDEMRRGVARRILDMSDAELDPSPYMDFGIKVVN